MAFFLANQGFNPYSYGGIGGLFGGMGGFNPYQQRPRMGGGLFGGFMPRFKRRARPAMPDYSGQIASLEEKIRALQEQLAARQTGSAMPASVPASVPASMPATRPTTASSLIPQVDPVALKELQDRIAGASAPAAPPVSVPDIDLAELGMEGGNVGAMMPLPRRGGRLPRGDVGGRKMIKPPSIERIMPPMPQVPDVMPQMPKPKPMTMPVAEPIPDMPRFPMPQIDPMGRVAAPLTRGPVNTAINRPDPTGTGVALDQPVNVAIQKPATVGPVKRPVLAFPALGFNRRRIR